RHASRGSSGQDCDFADGSVIVHFPGGGSSGVGLLVAARCLLSNQANETRFVLGRRHDANSATHPTIVSSIVGLVNPFGHRLGKRGCSRRGAEDGQRAALSPLAASLGACPAPSFGPDRGLSGDVG